MKPVNLVLCQCNARHISRLDTILETACLYTWLLLTFLILIQFVSFWNKMMPSKKITSLLSHLFRLLLGHVHQGPVQPPDELCVVSLDHIAVGDLPPNIRPVGCKHEWVWKQTNTASLEGNSVKSSKIFNASHLTLTQDTGVWCLIFNIPVIPNSLQQMSPNSSNLSSPLKHEYNLYIPMDLSSLISPQTDPLRLRLRPLTSSGSVTPALIWRISECLITSGWQTNNKRGR